MNELFYTTSRLTKIINTPQENERIQQYLSFTRGDFSKQKVFFDYCKNWKLAPWIYIQLQRSGFTNLFQPEIIQEFETIYTKVKQANEQRNEEATLFLNEFKKSGIEVAILKGNLFSQTVYKDIGYKRMNDFDILVHPSDWEKIQEIYFSLGYIPLGFGWGGEKQKPAKYSHTGIAFISRNFKCIIGTQWGLKSPTTDYKVNITKTWETSLPFNFNGIEIRQLSPEYNLLHLVLHMGIYKCGIRDCMDVYNLMLSENPEEQTLLDLFKEANALDKANFTLKLSHQCSDAFSETLLEKTQSTKSTFLARRLNKRETTIKESGDLHASYNDYFQDIEKSVMYFSIVHKFHPKAFFYVQILRQIFWPKIEIALKFMDCSYNPSLLNKLKARIKAPYFVFSLIAQEIGWPITFILFTKLFFDQILSIIYYIIPKETYFEYLKKTGINPKQIKEVVANVQ